MPEILIIEDHPIVGESLSRLVSTAFPGSDVNHLANGRDGLAWLNSHRPEIILLDINLPDMTGIEFCNMALTRFPQIKVLAITSIEKRITVDQILQAGAKGIMLKTDDTSVIPEAIQTVLEDKSFVSEQVNKLLNTKKENTSGQIVLTPRETEVLALIAEGLTNQEIADKLFISSWTVDTHRKNLLLKFEARNTASLVKIAMSQGLIG